MSESLPVTNGGDSYFVENSQLFNDILKGAGRVLDAKSVCLEFDLESESHDLTQTSGLPSAFDFLEADPTLPDEAAIKKAEIRQNVAIYIAQTAFTVLTSVAREHERAAQKRRFYDASASADNPAGGKRVAVYHPTVLASGSWRQAKHEGANGNVLRVTEAKLRDTIGAEYASKTELVIEDPLVKKAYGITGFKGELIGAHSVVAPSEDPLQERIIQTFGLENLATLIRLMGGVCSTAESDIDAELNDIWLNYHGTRDEQEVGSLLDEIKARHLAAKEAAALSAALGEDGKPNFQELIELNTYLASL